MRFVWGYNIEKTLCMPPAWVLSICYICGWLTPGFSLVLDLKNTSKTQFLAVLSGFYEVLGQKNKPI